MVSFKETLVNFMEINSITQKELADIFGESQQSISAFLNDSGNPQKKTREKYFENLEGFRDFYNKTSKKQDSSTQRSILVKKEEAIPLRSLDNGVPYFDIDFSGGWNSDELFTQQKPTLYITNPEFFNCDFACNLSGQSVSNSIPAGAIVGFKEIQDWKTYFSGGEFYGVVTKNDLRTVKIVKKIKGNKEALLLVPDPSLEYKDRFEEEEIPIDFIIGFYQVVAWAQFERLVM